MNFEEAEVRAPVVGYLSYDYAAKLEPTVQLPDAGRDLPESRFIVADTLVRFDHGRGMAEVLRKPGRGDGAPGRRDARAADRPRFGGQTRRFPSSVDYEHAVGRAKRHIRAGDAFQIVLSSGPSGRRRRARSTSTAHSAGSTPRRTSSCSSWTGWR